MCSVKKMFLEILQNSQENTCTMQNSRENTCASLFLIEFQALGFL